MVCERCKRDVETLRPYPDVGDECRDQLSHLIRQRLCAVCVRTRKLAMPPRFPKDYYPEITRLFGGRGRLIITDQQSVREFW